MAMNYFNEYDCDQFKFYQLPKELYELEKYKDLSNDACVLYAMLRDRLQVSVKNGWVDEEGRVYFIYTREEAAIMIRKTERTIRKYFNELVEVNLLEEKIDGRTYKLYLGKIQNNGKYIENIEKLKQKREEKREEKRLKKIGGKISPIKKTGEKFSPIKAEKGKKFPPSNTEYNSNTEYIKKEKKKKSNFDKTIENYTDSEELREAILEFIKFRKGIKSSLTDRALTLLLRNLDKFAKNDNEKIEIINQSILNGWKGIFPLKIDSKQNNLFNGRSRMDRSCDYL